MQSMSFALDNHCIEDLKTHTKIHIRKTSKICHVCAFHCGTVGDMDEHISIIHRENSLTTDMPQTSQLRIN